MKLLKITLGVLLAVAVLLLAGGLLLSSKFTVSRSVVVNAPADKVYALVASPRQWAAWSVWNQRDPAMQMSYTGPDSGKGAGWSWKSTSEGDGRMDFTAAEPGQRIAFELRFADFDSVSTGELRLAADGGATRVTWQMNGDMGANPLFRWLALFADNMVGKDFAAGLANLKVLAEKA